MIARVTENQLLHFNLVGFDWGVIHTFKNQNFMYVNLKHCVLKMILEKQRMGRGIQVA